MALKENRTDKTRNLRQARRREREKQWLEEHGWKSWEALHTALMNGGKHILSDAEGTHHATDNHQETNSNMSN